jgi:hypothetical protein
MPAVLLLLAGVQPQDLCGTAAESRSPPRRSTERFRQTLAIANPHHLKANAPQPKIGTIVDEAMGSTKESRGEKPVGTFLSAGFRTSPPCSSEAR